MGNDGAAASGDGPADRGLTVVDGGQSGTAASSHGVAPPDESGLGRPDRSDRDLLDAHAAGDPGAFELLVRRHRDRLWAVALRTIGDREEAADALQDALVSALRASSGSGAAAFRAESAVTTWLHRIVVNACLDRLRRRASRPADPLPEQDLPAPGRDPVAQRELVLDVEAALATLPDEQRAALVLVDMYGWSVDDAAEILDCAPGTVKSRCSRGRARLVPLLRPDLDPGVDPAVKAGVNAEPDAAGNRADHGRVPPGNDPPTARPEGGEPPR